MLFHNTLNLNANLGGENNNSRSKQTVFEAGTLF